MAGLLLAAAGLGAGTGRVARLGSDAASATGSKAGSLAAPGGTLGCGWDPRFTVPDLDGLIDAMVVFDDGSGPAVYARGGFTSAGGVSSGHVAAWRCQSWRPVRGRR